MFHFTTGLLIGGGMIDFEETNNITYAADKFFLVEPEVAVVLNVMKHFRIAGTIGYRLTHGVDINNISDNGLSCLSGGIMFKFGMF